jgi:hypothetical protein
MPGISSNDLIGSAEVNVADVTSGKRWMYGDERL